MGCIKSTLIKRTAEQLMEQMPGTFADDFESNKKILGRSLPSKRISNRVAGYISRVIKSRSKQEAKA